MAFDAGLDFEVLGRDEIGDGDGVVEIVGEDFAESGFHDFAEARALFVARQQGFDSDIDGACGTFVESEQIDFFLSGAVFRLRDDVGGDPFGVGFAVGNDHDFAGAGKEVDADFPEELALGFDDEGVARAGDFIDGGNGGGAVRHGSDGLDSADAVNFGDAAEFGGGEDFRGNGAVTARRGAEDELGHAGEFRGKRGHEHGRAERHLPAGDVKADAVNGEKEFADDGAVRIAFFPILREGALVEIGDGCGGSLHGFELFGLNRVEGSVDSFLRNADLLLEQLGVVELSGVVEDGFVAACLNIGDNFRDGLCDIAGKGCGGAECAQFFETIGVSRRNF